MEQKSHTRVVVRWFAGLLAALRTMETAGWGHLARLVSFGDGGDVLAAETACGCVRVVPEDSLARPRFRSRQRAWRRAFVSRPASVLRYLRPASRSALALAALAHSREQ